MALAHSPRIVTDGLVLCLDAGNTKSYPGSGTTWTDLSGQGNDGTLENGVGYSGDNGGSLSFDGSNDYVNLDGFSQQTNPTLSFFSWVFFDTTSESRGIWGHVGSNNNNVHFEVNNSLWRVRLGSVNNSSITTATANVWQYVGFTCTGNSVSFFINGNLISTWNGNTGTIFGVPNQQIGDSALQFRPFNGNIAQVKIYNKALTALEIQQNFNATRGRFGI